MPLVKAALGGDAQLVHFGCMLSFPGSVTQPWHSDGPHIRSGGSPSFVAPPHALNVFVPLVDLSTANGATEYVPGSQFDFDVKNAPCTPTPKAGAALLFDYRLKVCPLRPAISPAAASLIHPCPHPFSTAGTGTQPTWNAPSST